MIKAFLSHSSKQKDFVKELADILGRNFCIVDCYDFEPACKTLNEIYKKIEQSTVFVLLLTKESIASDWVNTEIRYAKSKLALEDYSRFWPYIIDDELDINDCPDWIKTDLCFNLKKIKSPKILARDIEQKFRRIIWDRDPKRKKIETLMVGRNADIDDFESIFQSSRGLKLKSLIISGRSGVGKDMFISQCLNKIGYDLESDPYVISLGNNEGVENFIIQLNSITMTYDKDQLFDVLGKSAKEKSVAAANLLNSILNTRSVISINDDLSCVQANRHLSDWIVDVVENSGMNNQLGLFIKSPKSLNSFETTNHPSFGHIMLKPLDTKDRTKLFYNLIRIYNINENVITDEDIQWFVGKLLLSPTQIVRAVDALSKQSFANVKRDIDSLISWGDEQIKPFVNTFFNDDEKKHLLIILSKLDFISYEILEKIYEDRIEEMLEMLKEMMDFGVVIEFGPQNQYFRLDHYFSDYIKRCRLTLPFDLDNLLNEVLEDKIENSDLITEDTSLYLYDARKRIMSGKALSKDFLIPSVVVSSVMEIYYKQDYTSVIKICRTVLQDVHNYYQEQERELRYWLCLALARKSDESFFEEVKLMKDADHHFLRGFYYRISMEYSESERWLAKALEKAPNLQRAKREMVTVLLAQNKFDNALLMAQENYDNNPDNSYQIQGYFRCLVRKHNLNRDDYRTLEELMSAMEKNLSDKHEELYAAMEIEYKYYVKKIGVQEMLDLIRKYEANFPGSVNIKRAAQPFKLKQAIITKEELFPED